MVMTRPVSISVVIATYRRSRLLAECLEALRAQAYQPGDEIIVVDNASGDPTADVLEAAAAAFPVPLRVVVEPEPGKTPALRTGIAAARGAILALTDDDVLVDGDWIATIRRLFEDANLALVGGRVDPRWEGDVPRWLEIDQHGAYGRMTSPLALLHYGAAQPLGTKTAVGANLALRRDAFEAVGGLSEELGRFRGTLLGGEDRDLCRRVAAAGYRCEYRPDLAVRHWVPASRARMTYFLRWFYWSGVTNALIEARTTPPPRVTHFIRRLVSAPLTALVRFASGRRAEAAAAAVDAAFATGYVIQRLKRPAALRLRGPIGACR
jgi:GT2 family glycosyltransferase